MYAEDRVCLCVCVCVCVCVRACACSVASDSLWPRGFSPPDSSVHGISQARILEWVAISSGDLLNEDSTYIHIYFFNLKIIGAKTVIWADLFIVGGGDTISHRTWRMGKGCLINQRRGWVPVGVLSCCQGQESSWRLMCISSLGKGRWQT